MLRFGLLFIIVFKVFVWYGDIIWEFWKIKVILDFFVKFFLVEKYVVDFYCLEIM